MKNIDNKENNKSTISQFKLLWEFMRGNRFLYVISILAIGVSTIFTLINPLIIRFAIDNLIGKDSIDHFPSWALTIVEFFGGVENLSSQLWIISGVLILITIITGLFTFYSGKTSAEASEGIAKNIREKLYDHLQHLSFNYHVKAETGDLIQRCSSDVDTIRKFLAMQFVAIGRALFMLAAVIPIMLYLDVNMTLITLITVPILFGFAVVFFVKVKRSFKESDEAEGKLSAVLQENLSGVRVVRAFARQKFEIEKFEETNVKYRDLTYDLLKLLAWYWSISDLISLIQIGIVLIIGSYWAATGVITLGVLVAFSTYVGMLLWPIRQMGRILTDMGKSLVSISRIEEILSEPLEADPVSEAKTLKPVIKGGIEFKNLTFEYEEGKKVLDNISFNVKPGETIAILGPTGSGKSTLVQLLAKLYHYKEGSIKIDGTELSDIDNKWIRKNVGIILQEPFLYSKSIKENIGLSKRDVTIGEIYDSSKVASVHDVIEDFEKGYETWVGEKGVTLSGGQKQRVAIARTIIKDSPILIFDDSLSAVDTETDSSIRKALKKRTKKVTTIIISHRVSTLADADQILVLDEGKLVQAGDHKSLIEKDGLYKRIWSIQNSIEDEFKNDIVEHSKSEYFEKTG